MHKSTSTTIMLSTTRLATCLVLLLTLFAFQANACDNNVTSPGAISQNQNICAGEVPDLLTGTDATGGLGNLIYTWMSRSASDPGTTYTAIPNSNVRDFTPGALTETTYFIRCVNREDCPTLLETEAITVIVTPIPTAQITSAPLTIPQGSDVDFSSQLVPGTIYEWTFEDGAPATSALVNPENIQFTSTGTKTITLTVSSSANPSCSETVTITIEVTAALPVELVDFNAVNTRKEQVELTWNTLSETNHQLFEIERSNNGSDYETIGKIEGDGVNSTNLKQYNFNDFTPNRAKNYYRLKQIDMDGTVDYSDVKVVTIASATTVNAYPNPVKDILTIQMESSSDTPVQLYLYHATSGQLLQMLTLPSSITTHRLDLQDVPSGMYLLHVMNAAGKSLTQTKLMKTAG